MEDDVERRDEVHGREHARHHVLAVHEELPARRNADQLKRNAKLDRNNRNAVEDLEQEEPLRL